MKEDLLSKAKESSNTAILTIFNSKPSASLKYTPSTGEANYFAERALPSQYKGNIGYNSDIVTAYRQTGAKNNKTFTALALLSKELSTYMKQDEVAQISTSVDLEKSLLRYAASVSKVSADEMDLFTQFINQEVLAIVFNPNSTTDQFDDLLELKFLKSNSDYIYEPQLHRSTIEHICKVMDKQFPADVLYPVPNIGKFGLVFLVQRYLEGVYPIGLPATDKKLDAHGVDFSLISFVLHDIFHAFNDKRKDKTAAHIGSKAGSHVKNGGAAKNFIDMYTPHATHNYQLLMSALQEIVTLMQNTLLQRGLKSEFKRSMAGLFWLLHEQQGFNGHLLDNNDLSAVLNQLVLESKRTLASSATFESEFDPFETSPFDGTSKFSDAIILDYMLKNNLTKEPIYPAANEYYTAQTEEQKADIVKQYICNASVKRSPRFIVINIELTSGQSFEYVYPTLYHKLLNMNDTMALLRMAGVNKLQKPDLAKLDVPASRAVVLASLKTIRKELSKTLDYFKTVAINLAEAKDQNGHSLASRYFNWHFAHEQVIKQESDQLIKDRLKLKM